MKNKKFINLLYIFILILTLFGGLFIGSNLDKFDSKNEPITFHSVELKRQDENVEYDDLENLMNDATILSYDFISLYNDSNIAFLVANSISVVLDDNFQLTHFIFATILSFEFEIDNEYVERAIPYYLILDVNDIDNFNLFSYSYISSYFFVWSSNELRLGIEFLNKDYEILYDTYVSFDNDINAILEEFEFYTTSMVYDMSILYELIFISYKVGYDEGYQDGFIEGGNGNSNNNGKDDLTFQYVWNMIANGTNAFFNIFKIEILPGLPLYSLISIPIIISIFFYILKIIKNK